MSIRYLSFEFWTLMTQHKFLVVEVIICCVRHLVQIELVDVNLLLVEFSTLVADRLLSWKEYHSDLQQFDI